ncbi:serine/threonine-protein kinase [Niveomyces insectorum RCEF 264]|uniref:non-specific serine/threonine protein kinase n=1 Tax=Niveomyces insectorum RCEF 264 TaxID=1081102 RepID=A0A162JFL0_9HYPO|nr:serine/threonine-protein kinase [Niveomyces insectorum RCEF 264]
MQPSQLDPLPANLPFRLVSNTIGRGAFASIKKATPLNADEPVFAVKLIHKAYAVKQGRITLKQITTEVALHSHIGQHPNVIEWFATGEDAVWRWIAMEYAEGGDLFDKIEADVGVSEDIAHLYFRQLVSGVSFIHSKGVAHRDLKPENVLLSGSGNLKLADFGMATMFEYKGSRKQSSTTCGSPPYIAPEVLACSGRHQPLPLPQSSSSSHAVSATPGGGVPTKYAADLVDIWSCGVILFVLLVGNTPWDEPVASSWEFYEYVRTNGHSSDPLWERVPPAALSLLRGMMNIDTARRFHFAQIRQHPWFTRPNRLLTADDRVSDPLELATQMLGNLRIDLREGAATAATTTAARNTDVDMDTDDAMAQDNATLAATQPEAPLFDAAFDWERHSLRAANRSALSSTQPVSRADITRTDRVDGYGGGGAGAGAGAGADALGYGLRALLADEPAMSQFSQAPGVPVSLTQHARRFHDIVPAYSLTRFFSHVPPALLVQMLCAGLHQLNVPTPAPSTLLLSSSLVEGERVARLWVRATDGRKQPLHGEVLVDWCRLQPDGGGYFDGDGGRGAPDHEPAVPLLEVRFVKIKGDPLEWRRFFKKMAQLCRDGIYAPDDGDTGM